MTKAQLIERLKEAERAPAKLRAELAGKKVEIDRLAGELFAKRALEPPLMAEELKEEVADHKAALARANEIIDALRRERVVLLDRIRDLTRPPVWIRFRQWLAGRIEP
jgi:uncharacterized protein (DUF2336 family)